MLALPGKGKVVLWVSTQLGPVPPSSPDQPGHRPGSCFIHPERVWGGWASRLSILLKFFFKHSCEWSAVDNVKVPMAWILTWASLT